MRFLGGQIAKLILAVSLLLLLASPVWGWSGPGHMIVAAIAYLDLSAEQRRHVAEILSLHSENENWIRAGSNDAAEIEKGMVLMMGASVWPDSLRFAHSRWNHREWHFVDYPVSSPEFLARPSPAPQDDIVYAINLSVKQIKDSTTSPEDRACWMSWLIHMVGDIHQPLHCSTLVNENFSAPNGDRGGNLMFVRGSDGGKGLPLHKFWDDAMGTSRGFHEKQIRDYFNKAVFLTSQLKRSDALDLIESATPKEWSLESWKIAVDDVYLRGTLKYSLSPEMAPVLPEGYTKHLKTIASSRVTLAGYRLADLIRQTLTNQ